MKVKVNFKCIATYSSYMEIPDGLSLEEQVAWVNKHASEANIEDLEFLEDIHGSGVIC